MMPCAPLPFKHSNHREHPRACRQWASQHEDFITAHLFVALNLGSSVHTFRLPWQNLMKI